MLQFCVFSQVHETHFTLASRRDRGQSPSIRGIFSSVLLNFWTKLLIFIELGSWTREFTSSQDPVYSEEYAGSETYKPNAVASIEDRLLWCPPSLLWRSGTELSPHGCWSMPNARGNILLGRVCWHSLCPTQWVLSHVRFHCVAQLE